MEDAQKYGSGDALLKPPKISGYRNLTLGEIVAINEIKAMENRIGDLLNSFDGPVPDSNGTSFFPDLRWLAIARTQLQQGFMALTRAVAKPESKLNPPARVDRAR